jgi:hypothetical protein
MKKIDGLKIDWDNGEGDVCLPEPFLKDHPLFRLDVLKDWIGVLERHYDEAYSEFRAGFKNVRTKND